MLAQQTISVTETAQQHKENTQTQATNENIWKICNKQPHLMNNIINNSKIVEGNTCEIIFLSI
jgi:hypothetical protein